LDGTVSKEKIEKKVLAVHSELYPVEKLRKSRGAFFELNNRAGTLKPIGQKRTLELRGKLSSSESVGRKARRRESQRLRKMRGRGEVVGRQKESGETFLGVHNRKKKTDAVLGPLGGSERGLDFGFLRSKSPPRKKLKFMGAMGGKRWKCSS